MCPTSFTDRTPFEIGSSRRAYPLAAAHALLACAVLALLTGCLPSRFTIDLAPQDAKLSETVVEGPSTGPFGAGHKVVMIDLEGLISEQTAPGLIASRSSTVDRFVAQLDKASDDPRVRAVVVRVNSPGGTVAASETIYNEINRFRARTGKPVIASFAEIAAGGGYYIALGCDEIVAQPSTITGSVGVIIQTFNVSRGMSMIGVEGRAVTSRANKDIANPFEPADESHYEILQGLVDEFYDSFRARVVEARPIRESDLDRVTDGRVFTGATAHELGLVDRVGGIREAFESAQTIAGIEGASLVKYHREGAKPSTPYARAAFGAPEPRGEETPIGWLTSRLRPGAYYLWTAGTSR